MPAASTHLSTDAALARAAQAYQAGRLAEAEAMLRDALRRRPDAPDAVRALAMLLQQDGRADDALALTAAAVAAHPDHAALQFSHGLAAMAAQRWDVAETAFGRAVALRPDAVAALLNRGVALRSLDRAEEAIDAFARAAELAPERADAHYNLGIALLRRGDANTALTPLRRAAQLAPQLPAVHHGLGNALRETGDNGAALHHYDRALALDPKYSDAATDAGMTLLALARPADALQRFDRALTLAPRDQTAHAGRYLALLGCGERDAARAHFDTDHLIARDRLDLSDAERASLVEAVLSLPTLRADPTERTTRLGQQSQALPVDQAPFDTLAVRIDAAIRLALDAYAADPAVTSHPWWQGKPQRWRLTFWATVLGVGGHQKPHLHPEGWLSGVCYPDIGQLQGDAGAIEFGHGPQELPLAADPPALRVRPQTGDLLLFPSFAWHRTVPYRGERPRISIAFDLIPL